MVLLVECLANSNNIIVNQALLRNMEVCRKVQAMLSKYTMLFENIIVA